MMSKGSKEALTVSIVTHVTHVKGVKRSLKSSNCYSCYSCQKGQKITLCTQYRYIQCYGERVERLCYVEKSFGKLRLRPFQPYHPMQCMLKHVEGVESQNNF